MVTAPADQSSDEGDVISGVFVSATDSDGDTVTYSAAGLPPGLAINSTTGEISGTLTDYAVSVTPYIVTVTVGDGNGGVTDNDFDVIIGDNGTIDRPGGTNGFNPYPPSQQVQIYNPGTDSWRYGPIFNIPRYGGSAARSASASVIVSQASNELPAVGYAVPRSTRPSVPSPAPIARRSAARELARCLEHPRRRRPARARRQSADRRKMPGRPLRAQDSSF